MVHQQAIKGKVLDVGCGSKPYQDCFPLVSAYIGIDVEASGHDHENSKVDVFLTVSVFRLQMKALIRWFALKSWST